MAGMEEYKLVCSELADKTCGYNYVVVVARYKNELVWVRQKGQSTWEIPGGHVESGESPEQAARRELAEETGALSFSIIPVCDFSIETKEGISFNRLFLAEILEMGTLGDFEIEEVSMFSRVPQQLTHGTIQPKLIAEAKKRTSNF